MFKQNFLKISEDLVQILKKGRYNHISFINIHRYRPGEKHEVHSHTDREEIFIIYEGKGKVVTDQGIIDVAKGDILVFGTNEKHGFIADSEDPLAYICIGVSIS